MVADVAVLPEAGPLLPAAIPAAAVADAEALHVAAARLLHAAIPAVTAMDAAGHRPLKVIPGVVAEVAIHVVRLVAVPVLADVVAILPEVVLPDVVHLPVATKEVSPG